MNSSNSFNICPRCGNSNTLNAKYCSRCGAQLKVPEEAVVCHKCHTRNSAMANFCRNCGTTLKVGLQTKICPRCGREVNSEDSVCACGYSFVTMQQTVPMAQPVEVDPAKEQKRGRKGKKAKDGVKPVYSNKGGRGVAVAALLLLLVFAYFIFAPANIAIGGKLISLRPAFLTNLDGGLITDIGGGNSGGNVAYYGYDIVMIVVGIVISLINGNSLGTILGSLGWDKTTLIFAACVTIVAFVVVAHLLVVIVRLFSKKRSKKSNKFFLVAAIISTICVGLVFAFPYINTPAGFLTKIKGLFTLSPVSYKPGWVMVALPVYFWFFFIYSACGKARTIKEQAA